MNTYFYQIKNSKVEHNVPETCIVCKQTVNPQFHTWTNNVIQYTRAFITKEQLADLDQYIMWCTENTSTEFGTLFIYDEEQNKVIATKLGIDQHFPDLIVLLPVISLKMNTYRLTTWPKRKVKVFTTKEEYLKDKKTKEQKRQEKNKQYDNNDETIRKTNPEFSLKTPKLKVVEVIKTTKKLEAKVGDIIQGELPVLEMDETGHVDGNLFGGNSYSNYIECYVNDNKMKAISPIHFQQIFIENYIVEIIN